MDRKRAVDLYRRDGGRGLAEENKAPLVDSEDCFTWKLKPILTVPFDWIVRINSCSRARNCYHFCKYGQSVSEGTYNNMTFWSCVIFVCCSLVFIIWFNYQYVLISLSALKRPSLSYAGRTVHAHTFVKLRAWGQNSAFCCRDLI